MKELKVLRSWPSATRLFVVFLVDRRTDSPKGALKTANFCGLTLCFTSITKPVFNVISCNLRKSASAGLTSIKTKKNIDLVQRPTKALGFCGCNSTM